MLVQAWAGKLCQCGVLMVLGTVRPVVGGQRLDLEVVALQVTQMGGLGLPTTRQL